MRILGASLAIALLAALAGTVSTPAVAQNALDQFEVSFQTREAQRRATISSAMGFDEEEATKFWPNYDTYRAAAKTHQLRRLGLVRRVAENAVGMDAETAQALVDAAIALDTDQQSAKTKFFADLSPHFSAVRYFRIYQMETKLDAIFRAGWTSRIPLALTEKELERLQMGMEGEKHETALPTT